MVAPVPARRLLPWIASLVALVIVLAIALVAVVAFPPQAAPIVILPSRIVVTMEGTFDLRNVTGPVLFEVMVTEGANASRGIQLTFLYTSNLTAEATPSMPYLNFTGKAVVPGGQFYSFWPHAVRPNVPNGFYAPVVTLQNSTSGTTGFAFRFWWTAGWNFAVMQTHIE